jgi:AraC-like DNA-binding protein
MNLSQQVLFFFSAIGVFNGLIISSYLISFKKQRSTASFFLGLLLLSVCLKICKSFIFYFYLELPGIYIEIGVLASSFVGPSLFYFINASLENSSKKTTWKLLNYGFWTMAIVSASVFSPYDVNPDLWNKYIGTIISAQLVVYLIATAWALRHVVIKLIKKQEKLSPTEILMLSILAGNLVIPAAFKLTIFDFFNGPCISGALFFSLVLYVNIFLFVSSRKTNSIFQGPGDQGRYANKKIAHDHAANLTERLQKIILAEELYKNPDLKLNDLARKINVSSHQLSQLLNDNLSKSFATYINEYRINQACELIANDSLIKLEAIGYEVGFNSKSTFYTAFKKLKNTTPTLYKESLLTD